LNARRASVGKEEPRYHGEIIIQHFEEYVAMFQALGFPGAHPHQPPRESRSAPEHGGMDSRADVYDGWGIRRPELALA
jgi:hypothetical protein